MTDLSPREKWMNFQRTGDPLRPFPASERLRAIARQSRMPGGTRSDSQLAASSWEQIGPAPIAQSWGGYDNSGRLEAISVDPRDPSTIYVSAAQGGAWKTTDGGQSWQVLTDTLPFIGGGDIVVDASTTNRVYFCSGSKDNIAFFGDTHGGGIFRSDDGGITWSQLGGQQFLGNSISRLLIHPANANVLFCAASSGLWKSTDGGQTWSRRVSPGATNCFEVQFDPSNTSRMWCSMGYAFGNDSNGLYTSQDGGESWSVVSVLPHGSTVHGCLFAISPSDGAVLYAFFSTDSGKIAYRTNNGGQSWSQLGSIPEEPMVMAVDPLNPARLFWGNFSLFRSDNGGASFQDVGRPYGGGSLHPDVHAIEFDPTEPTRMYIGGDGGMFRSTDYGWTNYPLNNNLAVVQFYAVNAHPDHNKDHVFGGNQDNGMAAKLSGSLVWQDMFGGDCGITQVNPQNFSEMYTTLYYLQIQKSTNGGQSWFGVHSTIGPGEPRGFMAPFIMDSAQPNRLFAGTSNVWRTTNGASSWSRLTSSQIVWTDNGSNYITCFALSSGSNQTLYVGTTDGVVAAIDPNTGTLLARQRIVTGYISSLAADPSAPQRVYATCSTQSPPKPRVLENDTGGTGQWMDISNNLPVIPANSIVVDPNKPSTLYLGCDTAVFRSGNGGGTWEVFSQQLPKCDYTSLALDNVSRCLYAATYGRSMYRISIANRSVFVANAKQPNVSAWPMFMRTAAHDAHSPFVGPSSANLGWRFQASAQIANSASASPDGLAIYFGCWDGALYSITTSGALRWKFQTGAQISSTPAVATDGTVYVGSFDHYLYAINPDGTQRWRYLTGNDIVRSSPTIGADGTVYVGSFGGNAIHAIHPDGTLKWKYQTGNWVDSSPAVASDGTVYAGSWDGYLYALNADGTLRWRYGTGSAITGAASIGSDGAIYVGSSDSYLYCLNPGGTLRWRFQMQAASMFAGPAIGPNGVIYVGSDDNALYAVNPDGSQRWRFMTSGDVRSTVCIDANGVIYAHLQASDGAYIYSLAPDGTALWRDRIASSISISSPCLLRDGTLCVGSFGGTLSSYKSQ